MKIFKRVLLITVDVLIFLFIGGWIYLLYEEFLSLPRNSELLKFSIFQIKLILFTLFLISSVAVIWFTGFKEKGKEPKEKSQIDLDFLKREFDNVKKLILTKSESESFVDIVDKKLSLSSEVEKIVEAKKIDEIFNFLFKIVEKITAAERISIQFYDFWKRELKLFKKKGFELNSNYISSENPPSYFAFNSSKRLFVTDIETHPGLKFKNRPYYSKKSFMIFPIRMFGRTFGVLNVSEKSSKDGIFNVEEFEKVSLIVTIFSQKMENILLYLSLEDMISQK